MWSRNTTQTALYDVSTTAGVFAASWFRLEFHHETNNIFKNNITYIKPIMRL